MLVNFEEDSNLGAMEGKRKKVRDLVFRFKEEDDKDVIISDPRHDDRLPIAWRVIFVSLKKYFGLKLLNIFKAKILIPLLNAITLSRTHLILIHKNSVDFYLYILILLIRNVV